MPFVLFWDFGSFSPAPASCRLLESPAGQGLHCEEWPLSLRRAQRIDVERAPFGGFFFGSEIGAVRSQVMDYVPTNIPDVDDPDKAGREDV